MRTSASQFQLLVEYMERNGNLSKPTEGPQGRATNIQRWVELSEILNADATGDTKTPEKWRKVWSDFKNNTKKKAARIHKAARGTGGGPATTLKLSSVEERVLSIVGTRAATGIIDIPEVGLEEEVIHMEFEPNDSPSLIPQLHVQDTGSTVRDLATPPADGSFPNITIRGPTQGDRMSTIGGPIPSTSRETAAPHIVERSESGLAGGNVAPATRTPAAQSPLPCTSAEHRALQSPTPLPVTPRRRRRRALLQDNSSPLRRKTRTQTQSELARQSFVRSDMEWKAFQRETEQERNRLRELEIRNQERWLDLFGQFLLLGNRVVDILEKK